MKFFLIFLFLTETLYNINGINAVTEPKKIYTNQFHAELHGDDHINDDKAREIGEQLGFTLIRRHLHQPNEFVYTHKELPEIFEYANPESDNLQYHADQLTNHPKVKRAIRMEGYRRRKRDAYMSEDAKIKKGVPTRNKYMPTGSQAELAYKEPNDPLFKKEWYIKNTGQADGRPNLDLNAMSAWAQGVTGKGITTAIMDDGIDYMHPDIAVNYNAKNSYDFSSNDNYPYPRYTDDWFNSHGTRCAGEISAERDNGICGVGVAYGSKVAGIRMLDQPYMTDLIEAAAMSHDRDDIDIYSASWGPTDDGMTVDGPRNQTMRAIVDGVNKGRKGKGSIYVWASGDGGANDDCNCDGYAASMWTISINSATNDGQTASYDESCSSTLASTFSNGKASYTQDAGVGTIDLYGNCTLRHSGTSAAAPEAAAVFALALEANNELTWRDLQHIIVLTSKRNHLHDPTNIHNWTINGAGLEFNHLFGFGVLDAGDVVYLSKQWKPLPERFHCIAGELKQPKMFNTSQPLQIKFSTDGCVGQLANEVNFLEHVQPYITVRASRRGSLTMFLTSPMGTTTMILGRRPKDEDSKQGFVKWPFMTTHTWGENPRGEWTLTVYLDPQDDPIAHGVISEYVLVLHGMQKKPYANQLASLDGTVKKLGLIKRQHDTAAFVQA